MKLTNCIKLATVVCLMFVFYLSNVSAFDVEYNAGYALSKSVEGSDLIVRGTVTGLDGVWRELKYAANCTTDVTIMVEDLIKGTPNEDKNKIKFMVEGGTCIDPQGEWTRLTVSSVPEFKIGERVLIFLAECTGRYCADFPYNKLVLWRGIYGKTTITETTENISWLYLVSETDASAVKHISLPLDLTINMCKAAVKDMDAVVIFEKNIKDEIRDNPDSTVDLSPLLLKNLKRDVKAVLEKKEEPEAKEQD